jgi:hypothetical protein
LATEEAKSKGLVECYQLSQALCQQNETLAKHKIRKLREEKEQ